MSNSNFPKGSDLKSDWKSQLENVKISRSDMNKLIMNYLVTEGFREAAEKFRTESGIQPECDLNRLDERIKIRDCVQRGQIEEAVSLVNDLCPELLDKRRDLFFLLQQQKLIELIRAGDVEQALSFAQTQLAESAEQNPSLLTELERTLSLLAFEKPEESPFGDLLHPSNRQKVASELNAAILTLGGEDSSPAIAGLVKLLCWCQCELDKRSIQFPKLTDIASGQLTFPS